MSRCPCCNRVIRQRKPKGPETPEEARKKLDAKIRTGISANLRKPMPTATIYKE